MGVVYFPLKVNNGEVWVSILTIDVDSTKYAFLLEHESFNMDFLLN